MMLSSSFRDPSGICFVKDGFVYRQVNNIYKKNYDNLMNSGLYKTLLEAKLLIPHEEVSLSLAESDKAYKIIQPELIPFISYPYEWCFSQLKDAALTTLKIQKICLEFGMSLKDSSAYNIQFIKGKTILIDTLSFEQCVEGKPWVAYRQFCQHFLAPLALMAYVDVRLNQLLRIYIDGVPLDLASSLLPPRSRLKPTLLSHIYLHAKTQKYFQSKTVCARHKIVSRLGLLAILDNLESAVKGLNWKPQDTVWSDYYADTNYSSEALNHKKQLVAEFLDKINPKAVWDLGANIGLFSRIASKKGIFTIAFDNEPAAVEKNYAQCVQEGETNLLPLLIDLANPSPGLGWENKERLTLFEREPADTVLALALIHHLAISHNLPFDKIADFFQEISKSLIIEFIPKSDSQVQRLLATREDIFTNYTQQNFEVEFKKYFTIQDCVKIKDSERILYLMQKK
jgi:hypothetical protein